MYAIHRQAAPPSGAAFSLSARLTPSCLQSTSSSRSKIVRNLVTATNDFLQLFEVVEEIVGSSTLALHAQPDSLANGDSNEEQDDAKQSEEKRPVDANGETQVSPPSTSVVLSHLYHALAMQTPSLMAFELMLSARFFLLRRFQLAARANYRVTL